MAITNYGELRTAVMDWLEDRQDIAPRVPDFIRFGSEYLRDELRLRQQTSDIAITLTNGIGTLPTTVLQILDVRNTTAPFNSLDLLTSRGVSEEYPFTYGGIPRAYEIVSNTLKVYPVITGTVTVRYVLPYTFGATPADTDTTWLLTYRPEAYLRTALSYAAEYIKDDGEAAKQRSIADDIIAQLNRTSAASYGRGGVTVRGPTP